jgi:ankyrin repeat protein
MEDQVNQMSRGLGRWMCVMGAVWCMCVACVLCGCGKPAPALPTQQETQEFHSALMDGDAAIVDRLLSAKPALANARDQQGKTPLAHARERGDDELAHVIERHGGKE